MEDTIELSGVATLYKGVLYVIGPPAEHQDVIDYIEMHLSESLDGTQQHGFLTNKSEFISVEDGLELAQSNGKVKYATL